MKIAIVAPSPVPFTVGGAEKLWWGLLREINSNTSHQAELIKIPTREHTFWDLIDSYERFFRLDLSYFDLVISTKYPAWMVAHPRHVCYMQHRLRGFYDCFHFCNLPERYSTTDPDLLSLQRLMSSGAVSRNTFEEVLASLRALRNRSDLPSDVFAFPGSFIREIVHFWDRVGLQRTAISSYFAISHTVAKRRSYFPAGASVEVVYHPSNLEHFRCGKSNYLFTASRLDGPKRVDLLIAALKLSRSKLCLRIAGEGPDRARLEELSNGDPRIEFLGYRSDTQLIDDYADALAVAYIPYDEDYGLITIEAMMSGKPVLTTEDAGGPNEFVRHGHTGLKVRAEPSALAEAIDYLASNRSEAIRMGERARHEIQSITWSRTVNSLLSGAKKKGNISAPSSLPRRLTVATTFPVTPVRGGGQARILHLYKNLSSSTETELITLGRVEQEALSFEVAPGLRETRIPRTRQHAEAEAVLSSQVEWLSVGDVTFPRLFHLTPEYLEALDRSCRRADVVVASHPYVLAALEQITTKPLWYEAQDVEQILKNEVIPKTSTGRELIAEVREIEQRCCDRAEIVMACSEADKESLKALYRLPESKIRVVPNGVNTAEVRTVSRSESAEMKCELGLGALFTALFIGSWHPPNLRAVEEIFAMAEQLHDVAFLIVGSSGLAFQAKPPNVAVFGEVDNRLKSMLLTVADVALNPMQGGSGTNLKMLEYASAGIPTITTPTGCRGLGFRNKVDVFIEALPDFIPRIESIQHASRRGLQQMANRARQRAEVQYNWASIAQRFAASL
jgi:glycosyltransferase involved in cell wall biosynthesis